MPDIVKSQNHGAQENKNYHMAMMETLMLTDQEAAKDSMTENYGDLLLSWWSSIPTEEKLEAMVYDAAHGKKISAMDAWKEAQAIQPTDSEKEGRDYAELEKLPIVRVRHAREKQIIIDVLYQLNFLYRKIEDSWDDGKDDTEWGAVSSGTE
jgi:uncharacterized protein HemY